VRSTVIFVTNPTKTVIIGAAHRNICNNFNIKPNNFPHKIFILAKTETNKIMANTYTQFYVHLVFSPKNKEALINRTWKSELEKYITGIVQNNGHKM